MSGDAVITFRPLIEEAQRVADDKQTVRALGKLLAAAPANAIVHDDEAVMEAAMDMIATMRRTDVYEVSVASSRRRKGPAMIQEKSGRTETRRRYQGTRERAQTDTNIRAAGRR